MFSTGIEWANVGPMLALSLGLFQSNPVAPFVYEVQVEVPDDAEDLSSASIGVPHPHPFDELLVGLAREEPRPVMLNDFSPVTLLDASVAFHSFPLGQEGFDLFLDIEEGGHG